MSHEDGSARIVWQSELARSNATGRLEQYVADRAPLFYRDPKAVADTLADGYFLSAIKETLARLPESVTFQDSHFAEIAACIFCEEVLGLRRIYSKLSLLTAENANAYKIDLVLYRPGSVPVEFVFGEVKSSMKTAADGLPPGHDASCFADVFRSLKDYEDKDLDFDLTAAKDHLQTIPEPERERIRQALKPYGAKAVRYLAMAMIDVGTLVLDETRVLAHRKSAKTFDVDLVCIEEMPDVARSVFEMLKVVQEAASCSS
jgi:hypothetical protein